VPRHWMSAPRRSWRSCLNQLACEVNDEVNDGGTGLDEAIAS
jgi:hypothetical protein